MGDRLTIVRQGKKQPFEKEGSSRSKVEVSVFIVWLRGADAAAIGPFLASKNVRPSQFVLLSFKPKPYAIRQRFSDGLEENPRRAHVIVYFRYNEMILTFDMPQGHVGETRQAAVTQPIDPGVLQLFERRRTHALAARRTLVGAINDG
jgi:hypothetical protein